MSSHDSEKENHGGDTVNRQKESGGVSGNRHAPAASVRGRARQFVAPAMPRSAPRASAPASPPVQKASSATSPSAPATSPKPEARRIQRASSPPARSFVAPAIQPRRVSPTTAPASSSSADTPEPGKSGASAPRGVGGRSVPSRAGRSEAAASSPLGAASPRPARPVAASRPASRTSAPEEKSGPIFRGKRRSSGGIGFGGGGRGKSEQEAPVMKGKRRQSQDIFDRHDGDPGPTGDEYGGFDGPPDYFEGDDDLAAYAGLDDVGYARPSRGRQQPAPVLGCPFEPDPEGYVPPMDWTFHNGGSRPEVTQRPAPTPVVGVSADYLAATVQLPTSDMPTEYPDPEGKELPVDIGLKWHLSPEKRHKHDLTPAEAGWQSSWGLFVPYDMEPCLPETPPPLPSRGFSKIYEWVCTNIPPEIVREHRSQPTKYVEGYLAKCLALGRRPDIYRRYIEAPAVAAAPSASSQKPTRCDFAP